MEEEAKAATGVSVVGIATAAELSTARGTVKENRVGSPRGASWRRRWKVHRRATKKRQGGRANGGGRRPGYFRPVGVDVVTCPQAWLRTREVYATTLAWWVSSSFPTGPSSIAWRRISGFISGTFRSQERTSLPFRATGGRAGWGGGEGAAMMEKHADNDMNAFDLTRHRRLWAERVERTEGRSRARSWHNVSTTSTRDLGPLCF